LHIASTALPTVSTEVLSHELRRAVRAYVRLQRRHVTHAAGSFSRCLVLTELARGPLTQRQLGQRLDVDKALMSRTATALVGAGLAQRAVNADDARSSLLKLTAAGRRAAGEINRSLDQLGLRILRRMSPRGRERLGQALHELQAALTDEERADHE
jgi:DNA-binding MarR family transcriptional regulator